MPVIGSFSYASTGHPFRQAGSTQWWQAVVTVCSSGRAIVSRRGRSSAGRHASRDEQADRPPRLGLVEPVQAVAGADARLAPRAGVEVDLEGVLLPVPGRGQRERASR